jgi:hypothetical protein
MLVVETIAKIRRAFFVHKKPIKTICRELKVSRKVVRKVLRSDATEFRCQSPIEMSLALPIREVTRGQGIAFCRPLRSRPWRQAARLSWSGLLGRAALSPLGQPTLNSLAAWPRRRGAFFDRLMSSSFCRSAI